MSLCVDLAQNYHRVLDVISRQVADRICGEHKFAIEDDVFGSGHLPDSVCAMTLALTRAAPRAAMAEGLRG